MVVLVAVAVCVAIVVPARYFGDWMLYASFAVIALGVVALAVLSWPSWSPAFASRGSNIEKTRPEPSISAAGLD